MTCFLIFEMKKAPYKEYAERLFFQNARSSRLLGSKRQIAEGTLMKVFSRREILISGAIAAMLPAPSRSAQKKVVEIGIIRWDAWFPGSPYSKVLAEPRWQERLPEFTKGNDKDVCICGSDLETLATEADDALDSGITYFAFNYYFPEDGSGNFSQNWQGMGQALRSFQQAGYQAQIFSDIRRPLCDVR